MSLKQASVDVALDGLTPDEAAKGVLGGGPSLSSKSKFNILMHSIVYKLHVVSVKTYCFNVQYSTLTTCQEC